MEKKKILLYADCYGERVGQSVSYVSWFSKWGEVVLVSSASDVKFWLKHGDILALPGGSDVDPARYNEAPHERNTRLNPHYEYLDKALLTPWIKTGKPILAICRGLQTLNVALGGTLFQDVAFHIGGEDRGKALHELYTDLILPAQYTGAADDDTGVEDWRLHDVNSYHHQAIKHFGEGLELVGWSTVTKGCPTAREENSKHYQLRHVWDFDKKKKELVKSEKDKYFAVPEIVRHTSLPFIGFQYHPEDMDCPLADRLISDLLKNHYSNKHGKKEAAYAGAL